MWRDRNSINKIEFDIICFLAQQNGRVVTYKELYEAVWNREYLQDDGNIMAHIHRIRQKIERDIKNRNIYRMCMVSDTALGNFLNRSLRILFKDGGQMDGFGLSIYNISYFNTH